MCIPQPTISSSWCFGGGSLWHNLLVGLEEIGQKIFSEEIRRKNQIKVNRYLMVYCGGCDSSRDFECIWLAFLTENILFYQEIRFNDNLVN